MSPSMKVSTERRSSKRIEFLIAMFVLVTAIAAVFFAVRGAAADDPECAPLPSGLVGWWPGNGNGDDIQGPIFDNGVLQNGALIVSGKVDQAFSFNGGLSSVTMSGTALKGAYSALTVDAWVYPVAQGTDFASGAHGPTILSHTDGDGFALRVRNGFIQADLRTTTGNLLHSFTQATVPLNSWSHVALTYDGTTVRAYLNGVELGTGVPASGTIKNSANATTCTMIGNEPNGCSAAEAPPGTPAGFGWNGLIDEVQFFDRALSAAELQAIYNADTTGKCHTNSYEFNAATYNVTEGNAVTITVTRSGIVDIAGTVDYATSNIGATAGLDYTAATGTLTFAPGETSKTFEVQTLQDDIFEGVEDIGLTLSNPTGGDASLGTQSTATIVIQDDDSEPTLSINDVTQDEGDSGQSDFVFTVNLSNPTTQTVTVDYATSDGLVNPAAGGASCVTGTDYVNTSGTLTFNAGETSKTISVPVCGDIIFELHETFIVTLSNADDATILSGTGTGTITNDDAEPTLAIDNITQDEGNSGTTNFSFTVSLSHPSSQTVTVDYSSNDGEAIGGGTCDADTDYVSASGTLTFNPSETSKSIDVSVCGDVVFEITESFTVVLDSPVNASIASGTGTGTITNDDAAPSFAIDNVTQSEGDSGTTNFVFTVTKTGSTALSSTVDFTTQDGTATVADNDYVAQNGTLNFGPADTAMQITVVVNGDTTFEADETFTVQLSNPDNATITTGEGTGNITNDDAVPSFAIDNVTENEGDSGTTNFVFTVTKTGGTALSSTVDFTTQDGTATVADNDYVAQNGTLNFGPTDTAMQITVVVNGDTTFEADEAFTVQLSNPANATITTGEGTGNITNDDAAPSFAIDNVTENEGDSGTTNFVFTVTKTGSTALSSTVDFTTQDGTATVADNDYVAQNGTLNFGPADTAMQITVVVNGDTTVEADETFTVELSNATQATIGTASGTGNIINDDTEVSVTVSPQSVVEDDATNLVYTFTRIGVVANALTVNFQVGGSATFNSDYTQTGADTFDGSSGTVTFPAGDASVTVTIDPTADSLVEGDEDVVITILVGAGYNVGTPNSATGTITDDETCPASFTVNDTGDTGDANLGDGICDDGTGKCTLRAAIEEANSLVTCGSIHINFAVAGVITLNGTELALNHDLFINGNTTNAVVINGNDASRIFSVQSGNSVAISNLTLTAGNGSGSNGGAIVNDGALTITGLTLTGNSAGSNGGAIYNTGTLTITNTTISGNTANGNGGGIDNLGTATITNVTMTNNRADVDSDTNGSGGGLSALSGSVTLRNSIIAGNFNGPDPATTADDVNGLLDNATSFNNLIGDGTGMTGVSQGSNGNQVGAAGTPINAQLGFLADNGGVTFTHALLPASPALDAGDNSFVLNPPFDGPPFTDQRGFARIADGPDTDTTATVDVGAFEAHPSISDIGDQVTDEDVSINALQFNVGDIALGIASITADSDNPALVQSITVNNETTANPDLTILLNADQFGQATITVTVTAINGQSMSDTFQLTVNSVNDDPTTIGIPNVTVDEDSAPTIINLTSFFNDVEDGAGGLVYTLQGNTNPGLFTSVNITGGQLTLEYAPNAFGAADITIRATDSGGKSVDTTFTVTVNAVNDPPTADNQAVVTDEDTPVVITLTGSDLENDPLSFTIVDQPTNGVLSGTAPNVTYTPNLNYHGPDSFTFKVNDGAADSAVATVSITVNSVNDAPIAVDDSYATPENTPLNVAVPGVLNNDTDVENDTLTAALVNGPSNSAAFALNPDGSFSYTPANGFSGTDTFTYKANDGSADSNNATVTITVNEGGSLRFSAAAYSVNENAGNAVITITRADGSAGTATVLFETSNGTATEADYTSVSQVVTFNEGETSKTVNVPIIDDQLNEGDETINLTLSNVGGSGSLGVPSTAVLTIVDDDSQPSLSIDDVWVNEGDSGTTDAVFTVSLSAPSSLTVTVNVSTADGTATAGSDYEAIVNSTLTFNPGDLSKTVIVKVIGDEVAEADETFFVNLSGASNATISDSQGVGTIIDDDPAGGSVKLSSATYSTPEGSGSVIITVERTGDASQVATVDYKTSDTTPSHIPCSTFTGSASSRCDYVFTLGTVRFEVGDTTKTIAIPIIDDSHAEGPETFTITLSNATGATLGTPDSSTITINDNETQDGPNPIVDTALFVRMHYLDFLAREPESSEPWSGVLNNCSDVNNDPTCDRLTVSAAFFGSPEFQLKGYFVYRFYKLAFDRLPEYDEIIPDITVVTGQTPAEVYAKKAAFSNGFAQRQEFTDAFSSMTNAQYVTALMGRYSLSQVTTPDPVEPDGDQKVVLTTAQLTSQLTAGTLSRAQILRAIADSDEVFQSEFNRAFVAMQYYGYLRRTPESAGYDAWLNYLNNNPSDFRTMVNGFVNSIEYKLRFGPP